LTTAHGTNPEIIGPIDEYGGGYSRTIAVVVGGENASYCWLRKRAAARILVYPDIVRAVGGGTVESGVSGDDIVFLADDGKSEAYFCVGSTTSTSKARALIKIGRLFFRISSCA